MFKLFLPYDVFERHKKVGSFIEKDQSVVDIGGELNHLSQFCSPRKIFVANLTSGDIIISKNKLPFASDSFDVACSIDVLEHIANNKRRDFIDNLAKIASKRIILSFPIGTEKHISYEKRMQKLLLKKGESIKYLNEHIRYGLPTKQDIEILTDGYARKIIYSGDIKINEILFRLFIYDPKVKVLRKIIYILKMLFNLASNELFYILLSNKNFSVWVNRAYVIIDK